MQSQHAFFVDLLDLEVIGIWRSPLLILLQATNGDTRCSNCPVSIKLQRALSDLGNRISYIPSHAGPSFVIDVSLVICLSNNCQINHGPMLQCSQGSGNDVKQISRVSKHSYRASGLHYPQTLVANRIARV